jgi:hypothetical protein
MFVNLGKLVASLTSLKRHGASVHGVKVDNSVEEAAISLIGGFGADDTFRNDGSR